MSTANRTTVSTLTAYPILFALSFSHLLNDSLQSLIPALFPVIKQSYQFSFSQIGYIMLAFQLSSSILQPIVGIYTDSKPQVYSLVIGMLFTLIGVLCLSQASSFITLLFSVSLTGIGSAIFHPEASRLAYMASGGKHGMAQSLFQVGGNLGSSMGPLLVAGIVVTYGQANIIWFCLIALVAVCVMIKISGWYKRNFHRLQKRSTLKSTYSSAYFSRRKVVGILIVLLLLVFSKAFYLASLNSFYTFYLIKNFSVSIQDSQYFLFAFLFAVAAGTFIGGPLGDRIGRKYVIWISILGVAPFTLMLPHCNLLWTGVLSVVIGLILSSAFSAILVYAQELLPGKVGVISGLFFGLAFGIGGIGSALLGNLADLKGINYVYQLCAYLPLLGILAVFLPEIRRIEPK